MTPAAFAAPCNLLHRRRPSPSSAPSLRPRRLVPAPRQPPPPLPSRTPAITLHKPSSQSSGNFDPENFVRPSLKTMSPYTPIVPYDVLADRLGRAPSDIVKLDANENPYGPAPSARRALAEEPYLHIYPDPESTALRVALSDYTGVSADYLLAGAGADELIDLLFRLLIAPGSHDTVINCGPTFGMYKFDADVNEAHVINVPRNPADFAVDVAAIEALFANDDANNDDDEGMRYNNNNNKPKMIFVASPNNPDGSVISDAHLERLLALPTLIVLDEAYFEFCSDDRIKWVPRHKNLVVLRTFSKWAGLAGLRVGYGAFPPSILQHLWKIKQPYNVSVASQSAAIASLREKADLLAKVDRMVEQRERFLRHMGQFHWLLPYPSQSNYVLCRVAGGRVAADVKQALMDRGILIRYYSTPGLSDCIRISMGTEEQMDRLYQALAQL